LQRPARREPKRSPLRLSLAEREEISRGLAAGESLRLIAGGAADPAARFEPPVYQGYW
jgi:Helix-turn-helix domain